MEIKARLSKPYSDEDRYNFIIEQNYNLQYEIKETETELQAWGYTEEEKEQQHEEFISHLKCTKRVLVLILQELGVITWAQLKEIINSNPQVELEWDLCVELERSNPLIDVVGNSLGLSSKQIDQIFKYANGIVDTLEVE